MLNILLFATNGEFFSIFNQKLRIENWDSWICIYNIVLKPGLVSQVNPGPKRSGAGTKPGLRKNKESQKTEWPSDPVDLERTGKKPGCIDYFF